MSELTLEVLPQVLGIVKLDSIPFLEDILSSSSFTTISKTDQEISIVADFDSLVNLNLKSKKWRALRFVGTLDFSLKGILAKISTILADSNISIFAISTYDTDYILVNESNFEIAIALLKDHYSFLD